jgi:NAD-dependent dihydropyrimidine dehydrogenase PreA subunit
MVVEVKIDYDRWTSNKECVEACSYGVLEWLEDMHAAQLLGFTTMGLECEKNCPTNAINVKEKQVP